MLNEVKKRADYIIDTSNLTLGMLKDRNVKYYFKGKKSRNISISSNFLWI